MAEAYAKLEMLWENAPLREKKRLIKVTSKLTTKNCSWDQFGAAKHIARRAHFLGA